MGERRSGAPGSFPTYPLIEQPWTHQLILAFITGLLTTACFPDFNLGALAWIALVPLHLALDVTPPKRAFWLGWLAGMIGFTGTMYWVITAMYLYGKVPLPVSVLIMLLLTAYLACYVALYAVGFVFLTHRYPRLVSLGAPCLWVTLEVIRTYILSGLPWLLLGYSQYTALPLIQVADHTGVYGISFVIVLVNVALSDLVRWLRQRLSKGVLARFPWQPASAAALSLCSLWLYGNAVLAGRSSEDVGRRTLTVGLVQANIDQAHKWDEAYRRETMDRYRRLTGQVAAASDLVIWPEAATPFIFELQPEYRLEVTEMIRTPGTPLLFGSPALRRHPDGRPYLLNSAYLLGPEGEITGRYDKQHLVPFGEYIPLHSSVLFFLDKLVEGIGDFEAGPGPTTLLLKPREKPGSRPASVGSAADYHLKFGVVICYEVIFPDLVRRFVANGADFMVTITNDAWFGRSSAPYQHFGMVVLRAVENHVAFARAANTGVSGFIDPFGRILDATSIFTEEALVGTVQAWQPRTFYSRFGDVFAFGCAIITALLCLTGYFSQSGMEPARGTPASKPV